MREFSRREALGLAGLVAALIAVGAVAQAKTPTGTLRPPGAPLLVNDFFAMCTRCQKCTMVCETGVIQLQSIGTAVMGMGTPILDFDYSYCNFCEKCYYVCPTGALIPPKDGEDPRINGEAVIYKDHCIAWSWTGCTVCYDVCPEDAIELDEKKRPIVLPEKCNGCGLCQLECPNAALRSFDREFASQKGILVEAL